MRSLIGLSLLLCVCADAQRIPGPRVGGGSVGVGGMGGGPLWRRNFNGYFTLPAGQAGVRDIERFENYLLYATPYCGWYGPGDYEANRALSMQMTGYLAAVTAAGDIATRAAAVRASRAVAAFPCMITNGQNPPPISSGPPPKMEDPPFGLQAPALENIPAADKETANDLRLRYESDAIKAALAWRNAEQLRVNLATRNMSLNAGTATALGHFKLFLDQAAIALTERNWQEAQGRLQAVEAETQKVANVVGH